MEIRLKTPDAIILSKYEGNRSFAYKFQEVGIEIQDAYLESSGTETYLGEKVLVPYGNIAYIILDNDKEEYEDDNSS